MLLTENIMLCFGGFVVLHKNFFDALAIGFIQTASGQFAMA